MAKRPTLFIFSGLPGAGKTTLAQRLAAERGAAYLRIDTVEQALRDLCNVDVEGEGYALCHAVAADNLRLGIGVVADSCNPIALTRSAWAAVATDAGAAHVNIEVVCSDAAEHRLRVDGRHSTVDGLTLPTWAEVQAREYHAWNAERIVVDTAGKTIAESFNDLAARLPAGTS